MITMLLIIGIASTFCLGFFIACYFLNVSIGTGTMLSTIASIVMLFLMLVSSQKTSNTIKPQATQLRLNRAGHTVYSVKNSSNNDNKIYTFTSRDGKTISVQSNKANITLNYNKSNNSTLTIAQKVRYLSFLGIKSKFSSTVNVTADIIK